MPGIKSDHNTQGAQGSAELSPGFDVLLVRDLNDLLRRTETSADNNSCPSVGTSLAQAFGPQITRPNLSVQEAEGITGIRIGNFSAWPLFVTAGYRNVEAPVYNRADIERTFPEYFSNGASTIRGGIGEACRNFAQHGHVHWLTGDGFIPQGEVRFGPGGVFIRELECKAQDGVVHKALMAVVMDEGRGIGSPQRSLVDGVGSFRGSEHEGMAVELKASVLYLVKSHDRRWWLFDGLNQDVPGKYDGSFFRPRTIGDGETVPSICNLNLAPLERGCQKIFFFAHPQANSEFVHSEILRALESIRD